MTDDEIKLPMLPCPFCGCENQYYTKDNKPLLGCGNEIYFYVNCARCTARVVGRDQEEAVGEWNRRTDNTNQG